MEVRLIHESEIEACNAMHNAYYGKNRTVDQWRWEFAKWRLPDGSIPYAIVRDAGKLVGTQALIPIRFIDRNGVFLTAKSEDTLIDPQYRGKNLFDSMYELLFRVAREGKIQCIWGFTPARGAFTRVGFDFPSDTSQLLLPLSSSFLLDNFKQQGTSLSKLKQLFYEVTGFTAVAGFGTYKLLQGGDKLNRDGLAAGINIAALDTVPEEVSDLSHRFVARWSGMTIYRDAAYYRWRLHDNPYTPACLIGAYTGNKLVGIVAFALNHTGIGFIVDIIACSELGVAHAELDQIIVSMLLCEASRRMRVMGASCVRAWSVSDHPFDRLVRDVAKKQGFFHLQRGHGVVRYTRDATNDAGPLNNIHQWYVTRLYSEGTDG
ncbi:GNAT family N-acetyltransferase [Polaromonas sp. YR568]|uniref:GNAT family N-acetyltransferase n=1 Tax=Polaromonas sp. YR568 TaxID=1855301 RepID=UPI00313825AC